MKKLFSSFLLFIAIQLGFSTMAHGAKICRVINVSADDVLNIRTGVGAHNPIAGSFAHNATNLSLFECRLHDSTSWCLVTNAPRNLSGWVAGRFLDCQEGQPSPASTSAAALENSAEIEQWCQSAPYCQIAFAGKQFYFPVGWKVTNIFAASHGQAVNVYMSSERQSDGARSWLNAKEVERADCSDNYPHGRLCFDATFQPISEQERNILGGKPNARLTLPAPKSELLSQNVDIIIKAVEPIAGLNYWSIQSDINNSYLADLDKKFIYPANRVALDFMSNRAGGMTVDTNMAGKYTFSAFTKNKQFLFDVTLQVLPTPQTQCFLIPNWTSGNLLDFERQLRTYHLPHYYSKENGESGYNDGNQPLTEGIAPDADGHGPDTSYYLAPVPCERVK